MTASGGSQSSGQTPARPPSPARSAPRRTGPARRGSRLISTVRAPAIRARCDEAGGRIDRARGADGDEQVAARQRRLDPVHVQRHLAEPDDVRAQPAVAGGAARARAGGRSPGQSQTRPVRGAVRLEQFAVHVDQLEAGRGRDRRVGAVVQVVDVLGDQQEVALPARGEVGQGAGGRRWAGPSAAGGGAGCRSPAPAPDRGRRPRAWPRPRSDGPSTGRRRRGRWARRTPPRCRRRSG